MAWPLPAHPDARRVPAWAVVEDEATLLNMPLPAYLEWARSRDGAWWLTRLRLKWRIKAAWELQERERAEDDAEDAAWRARGWRGGRTEPVGSARDS